MDNKLVINERENISTVKHMDNKRISTPLVEVIAAMPRKVLMDIQLNQASLPPFSQHRYVSMEKQTNVLKTDCMSAKKSLSQAGSHTSAALFNRNKSKFTPVMKSIQENDSENYNTTVLINSEGQKKNHHMTPIIELCENSVEKLSLVGGERDDSIPLGNKKCPDTERCQVLCLASSIGVVKSSPWSDLYLDGFLTCKHIFSDIYLYNAWSQSAAESSVLSRTLFSSPRTPRPPLLARDQQRTAVTMTCQLSGVETGCGTSAGRSSTGGERHSSGFPSTVASLSSSSTAVRRDAAKSQPLLATAFTYVQSASDPLYPISLFSSLPISTSVLPVRPTSRKRRHILSRLKELERRQLDIQHEMQLLRMAMQEEQDVVPDGSYDIVADVHGIGDVSNINSNCCIRNPCHSPSAQWSDVDLRPCFDANHCVSNISTPRPTSCCGFNDLSAMTDPLSSPDVDFHDTMSLSQSMCCDIGSLQNCKHHFKQTCSCVCLSGHVCGHVDVPVMGSAGHGKLVVHSSDSRIATSVNSAGDGQVFFSQGNGIRQSMPDVFSSTLFNSRQLVTSGNHVCNKDSLCAGSSSAGLGSIYLGSATVDTEPMALLQRDAFGGGSDIGSISPCKTCLTELQGNNPNDGDITSRDVSCVTQLMHSPDLRFTGQRDNLTAPTMSYGEYKCVGDASDISWHISPPIWTTLALQTAASDSIPHEKEIEFLSAIKIPFCNSNFPLFTSVMATNVNMPTVGSCDRPNLRRPIPKNSTRIFCNGVSVCGQACLGRSLLNQTQWSSGQTVTGAGALHNIDVFLEALLEDECALYAGRLQSHLKPIGTACDRLHVRDPVAMVLSEGDDMHFLPIADDQTVEGDMVLRRQAFTP